MKKPFTPAVVDHGTGNFTLYVRADETPVTGDIVIYGSDVTIYISERNNVDTRSVWRFIDGQGELH